jgi:hypothetical protein
MRRLAAAVATVAIIAGAFSAPASAGGWLSLPQGRAEIKSYLRDLQIGSQFASKVDTCYKPRADRVRCFYQTREYALGGWYHCYGNAAATRRWWGIDVRLLGNWLGQCYSGQWEPFLP